VILAVATPAMAADPFKGWYGALDLALTQPTGLDQQYANNVDYGDGNFGEVERMVLDNDAGFTWGAAFGYSFGKMGALQISYWGLGSNDSFDGNVAGGVYPVVAGYSPNIGGGYLYNGAYAGGVEFEAESDERATIWDIDYVRPMSVGEKFSVNWMAGLRVAEFRENLFFDGSDTYDRYVQDRHIKSGGWGFKVGAQANMDFTDHFGMAANLGVSFLQAESRGNASFCDGSCGSGNQQDNFEGTDDSQRGEIRDYGVQAVWHQGPIDIVAGFRASNWDGLVANPNPMPEGGHFAIGSVGGQDRTDVTFNSWHAGVKWKLGG
jgi:hypothetical protein